MASVRHLYENLFEDIPRGRKFAIKGRQGAWKSLPPDMKQKYIEDLDGYFEPNEDPDQEIARNSIVWEEGGDIHLAYVEEDGQELLSVWNDSTDSWDHHEAQPKAGRTPPDQADIDGKHQKKPDPHKEKTGFDPEKMTARVRPGGAVRR